MPTPFDSISERELEANFLKKIHDEILNQLSFQLNFKNLPNLFPKISSILLILNLIGRYFDTCEPKG